MRRKRSNRMAYLSQEQLAVFGISVFICIIFLLCRLYIAIAIIAFISLITIAILGSSTVKGKIGESKVSKYITKIAKRNNGYVINDVIIPSANGSTSQIDHILIIPKGIFVIETKNYSGRIYGNDKQEQWTQVLSYGNVKNKLYSPVKQNNTHIYNLSEVLGISKGFYNIVIFVGNNTEYIDSEYVFSLFELKKAIKRIKTVNIHDLDSIYLKIKKYKDNPISTSKEHVLNIKQKQKDIEHGICPRCGGAIVLRRTKDGRKFYGCSNYPRCKFVKKETSFFD